MTLPALLATFDKRSARKPTTVGTSRRLLWLAKAIERAPARVLVVAGVATVIAAVGAARFGRDAFEYDFRKLSARGLLDQRARELDRDMESLFGRWPQPTIIVTDRPEDVKTARAAIRRADAAAPGTDVIGEMVSLDDLLPGPKDSQQRKLALLADILKTLDDPDLGALDEKDQRRLTALRPPESLRVLEASDLPPLARRPSPKRTAPSAACCSFIPRSTGYPFGTAGPFCGLRR